jgi:DNA ligase-associated metallophosphoesterase
VIVDCAGEALELLPEKAAYWPAHRLLLVADIHFGKAATFRARGLPVPAGTTAANLAVLDAIAARRQVRHIVFLGDFLHARAAHAPATLATLRAWRAARPHLALTLVRGNHDSHAGDPPPDLGIAVVDEPWRVGPFAFCHHPQRVAGSFAFAGHLHPVFNLRARGDALRLPCFVLGADTAILPAFGDFTGGLAVRAERGRRLYLVAGDAVVPLPE